MNTLYDEKYDIRFAKYDEIDEIMQFIDKFWRKGHILATNREFFEYEFVMDNKVNFVIAKNKETREIEGTIGFNKASENVKDIWGACWKVRNDHPNLPFLGVELINRLIDLTGARNYILVGANPETAIPLFNKIFKYNTDKLNHYYRLSTQNDYRIAKVENKLIINKDENIEQYNPKEVFSIDELSQMFDFSILEKQVPFKDKWYYEHRFFNHPIYKYKIFATNKMVLVTREQQANGNKILRIVDFVGEQEVFAHLYDFFDDFLKEYEYIDFYNLGFNHEFLIQAGFVKKEENSKNIIPNYFSPFVQENIDIYVASKNKDTIYFKADADQDRPN